MLKRAIFGAIYVAVLLLSILIFPIFFPYVMILFCGVCLYEFGEMHQMKFQLIAGMICLSLAVLATNANFSFVTMPPERFIKIPYLVILASILLITFNHKNLVQKIGTMLFGVLYITVPFYLALNFINQGNIFIWFFVFFMVNDTFAYLTGMKFGKHKLAPDISPKKTIEGFVGGLVFTLITGGLLQYYFPQPNFNWMIVAVIASVFGTLGDLVESKIKREADVKDSSNFIPGHGGFLDRLDSFIFALPFIYLYIETY